MKLKKLIVFKRRTKKFKNNNLKSNRGKIQIKDIRKAEKSRIANMLGPLFRPTAQGSTIA